MLDAPWLDPALQRFEGRLARGQAPQAILIHGPAGIGRRHFALTVAARLLGSAWTPSIDVRAEQLDGVPHPDYWAVGIDEDSQVIKIDQIRQLIEALGLTSHRSGRKVGLVSPAESLTHNAANTLLKTLEEPPSGTVILLVADAPARLPATLVSRCERIRLSAPPPAQALSWLASRHPDRAACERALTFACGAPLMARTLLGDRNEDGLSKVLAELGDELQQLIDRTSPPTTIARAWAKRDPGICLRWLYLQTAELVRRKVRAPGLPGPALAHLKIPHATVNMAACCAYLDQVMEAQRLKDRSVNLEALFADLLMWWYGAAGADR